MPIVEIGVCSTFNHMQISENFIYILILGLKNLSKPIEFILELIINQMFI
jgi:hypothetical protein